MSSKFENVPVEEDTKILFELEAKLGGCDVLYNKWYWDGITAESLIFDNDDIADMSLEVLESEVRSSPLVTADSEMTVKRSDSGFTFVNFNFEVH